MRNKEIRAILLARKMLSEHNLNGWDVELKDVTSYHAQTWHEKKLITISRRSIRLSSRQQFTNMLYHEIAHALLGAGYGHGKEFKNKYKEMSGNSDFAGYATKMLTRNFLIECGDCNTIGSTNTKKQPAYCRHCYETKKEWNKMTLSKNPLEVVAWD